MRVAGISSWLLVYSLLRSMMIDDAEKKEEATMHFFFRIKGMYYCLVLNNICKFLDTDLQTLFFFSSPSPSSLFNV